MPTKASSYSAASSFGPLAAPAETTLFPGKARRSGTANCRETLEPYRRPYRFGELRATRRTESWLEVVPEAGLEPAWVAPHAPQTCVSAIPPLRQDVGYGDFDSRGRSAGVSNIGGAGISSEVPPEDDCPSSPPTVSRWA